jgi:hypothetical protein
MHNTYGEFTDLQSGHTPPAKRAEIYYDNKPPPSKDYADVFTQGDTISQQTPTTIDRNKIYLDNKPPSTYIPPDILAQGDIISKQISTDISRDKIYKDSKVPYIGNSPNTRPMPYVPPPMPGENNSTPIQGQIRNNSGDAHRLGNLYDDRSPLGGFNAGIKDGIESVAKKLGVRWWNFFFANARTFGRS